MEEPPKKKFRLGDIVRKLGPAQSSSPTTELSSLAPSPIDAPIQENPPSRPHSPIARRLYERSEKTEHFVASETFVAPPSYNNEHVQDSKSSSRADIPPFEDPPLKESVEVAQAQMVRGTGTPVPPGSGDTFLAADQDEDAFDIYRYLSVLLRRKVLIILALLIGGAISMHGYFTAAKYYKAHARLLFTPGYQELMGENSIPWDIWGSTEKKISTHLDLLATNHEVLRRVSESLDNKIAPEAIPGGLTIERGTTGTETNNIIEVYYKHGSPEIARDVVNTLCQSYLAHIQEVNAQDITRMIVKFEDQIAKVKADLKDREDTFRRFKEDNHIVELSRGASAVEGRYNEIDQAVQSSQLALIDNKQRFVSIKREINEQDISVVQSVTYSNPYQNQLADLEFQLNTLLAEYGPDHFKVQMVKKQIEKMREILSSEVSKTIRSKTLTKNPIRENLIQSIVSLTIEKATLDAKLAAQEKLKIGLDDQKVKLPATEQQYITLQRETESLIAALSLLQTQYEKAKIKRDSQESDLKILELAPTPTGAITTAKSTQLFVGFIVGLILGVALAFLLEYLDQTIKDPKDVERLLEVPLLGMIPQIEGENVVLDFESEVGKTRLEPFRALRASIKHLLVIHKIKTLIFCSPVKGEGKTTIAINLAISFAADGKKVILIDGDLRRPQLHSVLSIPKEGGLAELLLGTIDVASALKPARHENLKVVTAGDRPINPTELLGTPRFDELIEEFKKRADLVIFDSPALLPVSDALAMAPRMDAVLMVSRTLWTPIRAAQQAKAQLKQLNSNVIGTILNGISHSRGYYPYYYGYYRYYAYKYTYDYEEDPSSRSTMREWGLAVESQIRTHLSDFRLAVPRYVGVVSLFVKGLLRRPMFWILGLLLTGVFVVIPTVLPKHAVTIPAEIAYVGPAVSSNNQALGTYASPDSTVQPTAHEEISQGIKDSIDLWQQAWAAQDVASFLQMYDTADFSYPRGDYAAWSYEMRDSILFSSQKSANVVVDSVQPAQRNDSVVNCQVYISFPSSSDTVRLVYTQLWKYTNAMWRIVAEKHALANGE